MRLPTCRAAGLAPLAPARRWLVEGLWGLEAVGIVGGEPKSCLCRVRHKPHHAVSRIIPRAVPFERPQADLRLVHAA